MNRGRAPAVAFLLLAAAGAGFGWLGLRSVRLERREAERRDRTRSEEALAALEESPLPTAPPPPARTWTLVAAQEASIEEAPEDVALVLREATFRERTARDESAALSLLERLALDRADLPLGRVAAARGAAIARRLDERERARALAAVAAAADPALADPEGPLVRAVALRHLAALDLVEGRPEGLRRLLEESRDGTNLREDLGLDLGDALVAVDADPAAPSALPGSDETLHGRLSAAARAARWGHEALAAVGSGDRGATEDAFVWREGRTLHAIPISSFGTLFSSVETTFGVRLGATPAGRPLPEGSVASRAARFGSLVAHARPATPSTAGAAWWPVAAGLAVYLLAAGFAAASIARHARVARMQADFVAAVSHEMKTPVASVQAMAERLSDGLVTDASRARTYAARIHAEAARLGASVRNVLDASRIERDPSTVVRTAPVDPGSLVADVAESVRPVLEARGFRLDVEATPARGALAIDATALRSVLENLLDNAAKFSGGGREVAVRAGPGPRGGFRIEVLDRGPGVPAGDRDRVFRRFYRGEGARRDAVPGLGLGLHVARALVVAHGGSLTVADREGGGAAFTVDLPDPVA